VLNDANSGDESGQESPHEGIAHDIEAKHDGNGTLRKRKNRLHDDDQSPTSGRISPSIPHIGAKGISVGASRPSISDGTMLR